MSVRRLRNPLLVAAALALATLLAACNNDPCPTCRSLRDVQQADFALCVSLVPDPSDAEEECQDIGIDYVVVE